MSYDLLIIGGGAAGNGAAFRAVELGKSVALIERDKIGGTCTNYGCDPTKYLLEVAERLHAFHKHAKFGIEAAAPTLNWQQLQLHMRQRIDQMRGGAPQSLTDKYKERGVDLVYGSASFVNAQTVAVGGRSFSAENILIASGTEPTIPTDIDGLEQATYVTNKNAPYLNDLPQSLAVIGGGPVGVEFSQLFSRFGVRVTLVESSDHILPKDDADLANMLAEQLCDEGINIITGYELSRVEQQNEQQRLTLRSTQGGHDQTVEVELILLALGRRPALGELQPAQAGVELTDDGYVAVDDTLRSSVSHIWAAGDITGGKQFTHVASHHGPLVADNMFSDSAESYDGDPIPWVTYTSPSLANIGKTERQLIDESIAYDKAVLPLGDVSKAQLLDYPDGLVKLLFSADKQQQLLGGHILAPNASDLLGTLILALRSGQTLADLATLTMPYPSLVEAVSMAAHKGINS